MYFSSSIYAHPIADAARFFSKKKAEKKQTTSKIVSVQAKSSYPKSSSTKSLSEE